MYLHGSNNVIGGTTPAARNLISGNAANGIDINGDGTANSNLVQGNLIGTNFAGTTGLGNQNRGILLASAGANTIGGSVVAARNVISGNGGHGVELTNEPATSGSTTTLNVIQGNFIGTQADGISALGNAQRGVAIFANGGNNGIGGTVAGAGNTIAFNNGIGIGVSPVNATGNAIRGNSIFSNGGLGIDLNNDGITPNDAGDPDTGPNNLQNFPLLTSVTSGGGSTTIQGNLNSTASTTFRVEFFSNPSCDPSGNGEGQTFIDFKSITTNGNDAAINAVLPVGVTPGQFVTSTATDPNGNTSEFSACVLVTAAPTLATVDGRALTSDGRGLRNAIASMTDSNGVVRTTTTSSFGFFSFDNVPTGQTYTIRISSRLFRYQPQTVQVNGNMTLPDFVGLE